MGATGDLGYVGRKSRRRSQRQQRADVGRRDRGGSGRRGGGVVLRASVRWSLRRSPTQRWPKRRQSPRLQRKPQRQWQRNPKRTAAEAPGRANRRQSRLRRNRRLRRNPRQRPNRRRTPPPPRRVSTPSGPKRTAAFLWQAALRRASPSPSCRMVPKSGARRRMRRAISWPSSTWVPAPRRVS